MPNMKMSAKEAKEWTSPTPADAPEYPYGLELSLDEESLAKLGISTPPAVGTQFTVIARCTVTSASQYQTQGGEPEGNSCWQITDMEVAPASSLDERASSKLYGAKA